MAGLVPPKSYYTQLVNEAHRGSSPMQRAKMVILEVFDILRDKAFKEQVGIVADEMFVGGSVGQGTTVPGHYDLDLVIYSKSICVNTVLEKKVDGTKKGYSETQDKLEEYLKTKLSSADDYNYHRRTWVAIQFKYKQLEIDLLLSPYWKTKEEYYSAMKVVDDTSDRYKWFSVSTSKYQTEFIRKHKGQVEKSFIQKYRGKLHELIKRAKIWRNKVWTDKNGQPKSYLLSLLVICAFDEVGKEVQMAKKFKTILEPVTEKMKTLVDKIATERKLDGEVLKSDLLCSKPRIIDPANPVNNLYFSGVRKNAREGERRWDVFKEKVKSFDITTASVA